MAAPVRRGAVVTLGRSAGPELGCVAVRVGWGGGGAVKGVCAAGDWVSVRYLPKAGSAAETALWRLTSWKFGFLKSENVFFVK